ncbi:MAG: flavin reductase [Elusimicrobiales bacterium]|nr:flavin reductase [Elusimicrobiales bacterium]
MKYSEHFDKLCAALEGSGAFLVVEDHIGRINIMTIGWAQVGVVWGQPVMTVLVRPSRHTHDLMAKAAHFSVCVPRQGGMQKELAYCGSKSGRDYDKARVCGLTLKEGYGRKVKYIEGCELVYQCELYGNTGLQLDKAAPPVLSRYYPGGDDPHTVYFGRIVKAEKF